MTTTAETASERHRVNRPTRSTSALVKPEAREIAAPPVLTDDTTGTPFQVLLPIMGAVTSVSMMVVLRHGNPLFLVVAALVFLVAVVGGIGYAVSARGRATRQLRARRTHYLDYLERTSHDLREESETDRKHALLLHPAPHGLGTFVRDPRRLWERRREDTDRLQARVGTATVPWFDLYVPSVETPTEPADPILQQEAELLADSQRDVHGMPALVELSEAGTVAVIGSRDRTLEVARAILLQLAAHESPDDLQIAAVYSPERSPDWVGLDLLPHVQDPRQFDGPVPARRVAPTLDSLVQLMRYELLGRTQDAAAARRRAMTQGALSRLLIVVDSHGATAAELRLPDPALDHRSLGITMVHLLDDRLDEPDDVDVRIELHDDGTDTLTHGARTDTPVSVSFDHDHVPGWMLQSLSRVLAAQRTLNSVAHTAAEQSPGALDLIGYQPAPGQPISASDIQRIWAPRTASDFLRVPFGMDDQGRPVHLDIKESAQQGMGPHGLCIGATGSGKSELLRTLILSLAVAHPPEDLSMILIDYKGGAAFAPFAGLPHLSGLIDNLADDPQLTVRARSSLQGEVVRRQQMLKAANSSPSITHYRQLRKEHSELPPMPHLFVVIDEFGELLTAEPDFIDLFLQIGRIGRSIGVHLLLSSQRIEGGKLRGLDTYLSYRLGLRTFSEAESQTVLGNRDAFHLPPLPGYGYLKVDTSIYERFHAEYVSGAVQDTSEVTEATTKRVMALPVHNGLEADIEDLAEQPVLRQPETGPSLVDLVAEDLRSAAPPARPIWLNPLPGRLSLGEVADHGEGVQKWPSAHAERGHDSVAPAEGLSVMIGLEDDPLRQRQGDWVIDLTRAGGHVAIIGGPQSGKSTALRTIAASLALRYTSEQVAIYGMDLTGGGLRRLEDFPQVGGIAVRGDETRLMRLLEEVTGMLSKREEVFRSRAIESLDHMRQLHGSGDLPELPTADIILLVDGYGALRQDTDGLESVFTPLMQRAAGFGIHIVLTLSRWSELRMAHQSLFGTRIELRLNDPIESAIDRKLAETIPKDTPGRALNTDSHLCQFALPLLNLVETDQDMGTALSDLAGRVAAASSGPAAAPIRLLPRHLDPAELPDPVTEPATIPIGLRQDTMEATDWDFMDRDQHLVVVGDARSGKSTLLRTIAQGLVERFDPSELAIAVIDPRGKVPGVIPEEFLAGHARSAHQASAMSSSIASELQARPARSAAEQARSPRIVLLVDDHDIIAAGGTEPLSVLMPYLPSSRDLDFHVVLTRPVAGASRALFGSALQSIRNTGGSLLVLSGDRNEGQLLPKLYPERMPPGRGRFVRRGESAFVVQIAETHPAEPAARDSAQLQGGAE
ncbi:type VII secretion protein EccCa [Kocuria sp.]|uniref:type VII secretion protein EccCa n=1 Tax=Kocuria sp. TaxID=1871328 RepID=UPI0026E062A4|nr:type VII secretion protein EccCa [Kocuria sp.]MDO5619472.1 type VII secretion protein EccCa [Kocuria sp.]